MVKEEVEKYKDTQLNNEGKIRHNNAIRSDEEKAIEIHKSDAKEKNIIIRTINKSRKFYLNTVENYSKEVANHIFGD